jgi:hypothetical protein
MATGGGVEWSDYSGKVTYGAAGPRDVLLIVSEGGDESPLPSHPDVVRRRPAIELTEEVRGKLENQGIPRQHQHDELAIIRARYELDKNRVFHGVEMTQPGGERLTRERVLKQIAILMNNHDNSRGGGRPTLSEGRGEVVCYVKLPMQFSSTTLVMGRGGQGTGVSRMASSPLLTWLHCT